MGERGGVDGHGTSTGDGVDVDLIRSVLYKLPPYLLIHDVARGNRLDHIIGDPGEVVKFAAEAGEAANRDQPGRVHGGSFVAAPKEGDAEVRSHRHHARRTRKEARDEQGLLHRVQRDGHETLAGVRQYAVDDVQRVPRLSCEGRLKVRLNGPRSGARRGAAGELMAPVGQGRQALIEVAAVVLPLLHRRAHDAPALSISLAHVRDHRLVPGR